MYYKSPKTSSLIRKNNLAATNSALLKISIIYQYKCQIKECMPRNVSHFGQTRWIFSRHLTNHLQGGGIKVHHQQYHSSLIYREEIVNNTNILFHTCSKKRTTVLEAECVRDLSPVINIKINITTKVSVLIDYQLSVSTSMLTSCLLLIHKLLDKTTILHLELQQLSRNL